MAQETPQTSPPSQDPAADPAGPAALRRRVTPGDARRFAVGWVRSTPGTHAWLLILAVTSVIAAAMPPHPRSYLLHHVSTNLVELRHHPIRVLVASALWIQTPSGLILYTVLFEVVHATAERWLGTFRWLMTAAVAHVGATLFSQKAVFFGIRDDRLPHSLAHTVDIGVSYGLAGVAGVLTYLVPRPWRWPYLAGLLGYFGYRLVHSDTFTDLGHLTAVLIGLCCYAITPPGTAPKAHRPALWDRRPAHRPGRTR
jgi:hypothetical protein